MRKRVGKVSRVKWGRGWGNVSRGNVVGNVSKVMEWEKCVLGRRCWCNVVNVSKRKETGNMSKWMGCGIMSVQVEK